MANDSAREGDINGVGSALPERGAPRAIEKVLVLRLSSIGDIVHALPAVSALAETFPNAQIDWVVEDRYACLLDGNPCLRRVIRLDTLGWRKRWASTQTMTKAAAALREIRSERYDAVIDFQGLIKTGVLARLCRAPRRIGYAHFRHRERGAGLFYTDEVELPAGIHAVEENLALVASLGARASAWKFPLPQQREDEECVSQQLAAAGVEEFAIINPGGGWLSKRWPPESYARLIQRISSERKAWPRLILTGSEADEPVAREILLRAGPCDARFIATTLTQYVALARRARLFLGGDTGPMHLAAALGVPVVAILGPTDPRRNGPFCAHDIVLSNHGEVNHSRRRDQSYLEGVTVESVFGAVQARLGQDDAR